MSNMLLRGKCMNSVMFTGKLGVDYGMQAMQQAATQIASQTNVTQVAPPTQVDNSGVSTNSDQGLAKPLIDLNQAKVQTEASAKVLEADSQVTQSLIDMFV